MGEQVFDIDGRRVVITFETKVEQPEIWIETILNVCKSNEFAKALPEIYFNIVMLEKEQNEGEEIPKTGAFVKTSDLVKGRNRIFLNRSSDKKLPEEQRKEIAGCLTHELIHLWQDFITKRLRTNDATYRKLVLSLSKEWLFLSMSSTEASVAFDINLLRSLLFLFVRKLSVEGLAVYCELQLERRMEFSQQEFRTLLINSKAKAMVIKAVFEEVIKRFSTGREQAVAKKLLFECLRGDHYELGLQMVFTIIYVNKRSLEYIAKLKPFEFIKEYEECMEQKGERPVISATSGKGILDYKRMVEEWAAMVKEYKQRKKIRYAETAA